MGPRPVLWPQVLCSHVSYPGAGGRGCLPQASQPSPPTPTPQAASSSEDWPPFRVWRNSLSKQGLGQRPGFHWFRAVSTAVRVKGRYVEWKDIEGGALRNEPRPLPSPLLPPPPPRSWFALSKEKSHEVSPPVSSPLALTLTGRHAVVPIGHPAAFSSSSDTRITSLSSEDTR